MKLTPQFLTGQGARKVPASEQASFITPQSLAAQDGKRFFGWRRWSEDAFCRMNLLSFNCAHFDYDLLEIEFDVAFRHNRERFSKPGFGCNIDPVDRIYRRQNLYRCPLLTDGESGEPGVPRKA